MRFSKIFKKETEEEKLKKFIDLKSAFRKKLGNTDDFHIWKKNSESFQEDYERIKSLFTTRFDEISVGTKFWSNGWAFSFDYGIKTTEEGENTLILYSEYSYKQKEMLGCEKVLIDPTADSF